MLEMVQEMVNQCLKNVGLTQGISDGGRNLGGGKSAVYQSNES